VEGGNKRERTGKGKEKGTGTGKKGPSPKSRTGPGERAVSGGVPPHIFSLPNAGRRGHILCVAEKKTGWEAIRILSPYGLLTHHWRGAGFGPVINFPFGRGALVLIRGGGGEGIFFFRAC